MKRSLMLLAVMVLMLWAGAVAAASYAYPPRLLTELRLLQRAALDSRYAWQQVAHLADNIGPRLSGSPQAEQAIRYVAAELRRLGMEVSLEPVVVPHWVRGAETAELVEYPGQAPGAPQKIVLTALGGSVATPSSGLTADVVVVDSFEELEALPPAAVAGKVVLYDAKFDKGLAALGYGEEAYSQAVRYRGGGAVAAARRGAVASLVRSVGGAEFRLPHTGGMHYDSAVPKIPAAAVTAEDADLVARLAAQGRVRMHLLLTPETLPDAPSYNVVGDLKGTAHAEQIVIASGHLDSWDLGTGAIDDGAGVAVAMAAAELMVRLHLKPERTVRVIAWMNEENGLAGARAYAADHRAELDRHLAAIESDLGAGHPGGFIVHATHRATDMLDPARAILEASGAGIMRPVDGPCGADVSIMDDAGVPTLAPLQDSRTYFDYHHTAADTLDKIQPRELSENVAVMAVLAYALANMPDPLSR